MLQTAAPAPNDLEAYWMPFTANRQFKARSAPAGRRGRHVLPHCRWPQDPRWHRGAMVRQRRPWPRREITEAVRAQIEDTRLRAGVPDGPSGGIRAGGAPRRAIARGSRPRVLHQLGLGSRSTPRSRSRSPITAPAARRARTRLIGRERGYHGVGFGGISVGGIAGNRKAVRAAAARRRPSAAHPRSRAQTPSAAASRRTARARRRARAHRRAARRLDHRRSDRRAGGRLDRRTAPAQGLSRAPAQDLRQARHPADLRRGDHRLWPARRAVRRRAISASTPDLMTTGQGPDQRRRADGRQSRAQGDPRRVHDRPGERHRAVPWLYLFRPSAGLRGRPRDARHLSARGPVRRAPPTLAPYWEEAVHALRGLPHVIDIRNIGLMAGIELEPRPGSPGRAATTPLSKPSSRGC